MIDFSEINSKWTLFLDRDGVINHEKAADYIRNPGEFRLYDGVIEAIPVFNRRFARVIVVTNQKGIGKGWMTEADLEEIHQHMQKLFATKGGLIDGIFFCPDLDQDSPNRKPNPGMGLQAAKAFPEIDFHRSIMVGNTMSDMQFGKTLGMKTIFIPSTKPMPQLPDPLIDGVFESLLDLAKAL